MATFKSVTLKSKNDIKRDGTTNVKIRITHNRKIAYISTEIFVPANSLNNQGLVESGSNMKRINTTITNWLLKCRMLDLELGEKAYNLSAKEIKALVLNGQRNSDGGDFFQFGQELIGMTKNKGTAGQYQFLLNRVEAFIGPYLPFSEINLNFLQRFEAYLHTQGARNGIVNYMVTFRAIFNKARNHFNKEEIGQIPIPHYPFRLYNLPKRKPHAKEHVLTKAEFRLFMNYKPINEGEEFAKDMFLLMFYLIGIESVDLYHLQKDVDNRIHYDRFKTQRHYSIKIEPPARAIINKYKSSNKKNLLNIQETFSLQKSFLRKINNYLCGNEYAHITGIFQRLEIPKKVTTKWARHTWATFARNDCRINKDDVALCLGHEDKDNQVTDMYIKYDYSIIDESNEKVINLIADMCQ